MYDRANSAEEFTKYYEEHKNSIFNYLLYRVAFKKDIAEDLTSEIFLKAFEHFDSYDRARPFKTWIFAIAHNHLVNYYAGRKETLPLNEAIELVKKLPEGDDLDEKMLIANILGLVEKLPTNQRDLIVMRYVNDISNQEIAEILGKEEGAVRTGLSRAIAALREQYEKTNTSNETHHENQ